MYTRMISVYFTITNLCAASALNVGLNFDANFSAVSGGVLYGADLTLGMKLYGVTEYSAVLYNPDEPPVQYFGVLDNATSISSTNVIFGMSVRGASKFQAVTPQVGSLQGFCKYGGYVENMAAGGSIDGNVVVLPTSNFVRFGKTISTSSPFFCFKYDIFEAPFHAGCIPSGCKFGVPIIDTDTALVSNMFGPKLYSIKIGDLEHWKAMKSSLNLIQYPKGIRLGDDFLDVFAKVANTLLPVATSILPFVLSDNGFILKTVPATATIDAEPAVHQEGLGGSVPLTPIVLKNVSGVENVPSTKIDTGHSTYDFTYQSGDWDFSEAEGVVADEKEIYCYDADTNSLGITLLGDCGKVGVCNHKGNCLDIKEPEVVNFNEETAKVIEDCIKDDPCHENNLDEVIFDALAETRAAGGSALGRVAETEGDVEELEKFKYGEIVGWIITGLNLVGVILLGLREKFIKAKGDLP